MFLLHLPLPPPAALSLRLSPFLQGENACEPNKMAFSRSWLVSHTPQFTHFETTIFKGEFKQQVATDSKKLRQ